MLTTNARRSHKTRSLLLLVVLSCLISSAPARARDLEQRHAQPLVARGLFGGGFGDETTTTTGTTSATGTTTSNTATTTGTSSTGTTTGTSATTTGGTTTGTTGTTTGTTSGTSTGTNTSGSAQSTGSTGGGTTSASGYTTTSAMVTTGSNGQEQTVVVTMTRSSSAAASSTSSAADNSNSGSSSGGGGSSGVSTSTIIGLSVAGGVAVIGIVSFFIWKFTHKRLVDDDFDNEAIKWPDLNNHGASGLAAAAASPGNSNNLSRSNSHTTTTAGYAPSVAASSTADLYQTPDPYAVPPLPHLNPNHPYHDDPGAGYYDPYRGPVPQTFSTDGGESGQSATGHEVIPMTQLVPGGAVPRARSPGPGPGPMVPPPGMYDMAGRASPAPPFGYAPDGRASPAPRLMTPALPPMGLGLGMGMGMGPGMGMGGSPVPVAGRRSPGPQAAFDPAYGMPR